MDDNETCHRTHAVQDCLDSEGIQRLVWPARSPNLNPIENVWDALGRQVAGRNYPPTNKNTPICALTEEWDKLPQQLLDNVVQNMSGEQKSSFQCCRDHGDRGMDQLVTVLFTDEYFREQKSPFPMWLRSWRSKHKSTGDCSLRK
ncbi:transposable element Tcb1 transposase [Trichonephila clavipes]|nr:transposable element Tcb1 transposase [Trichonephila clavipes]